MNSDPDLDGWMIQIQIQLSGVNFTVKFFKKTNFLARIGSYLEDPTLDLIFSKINTVAILSPGFGF
jgi:hypothetical protein